MTTKKTNSKTAKKTKKSVSKKKTTSNVVVQEKVEPNVQLSRVLSLFTPTDILDTMIVDAGQDIEWTKEDLAFEKDEIKHVSSSSYVRELLAYGSTEKEVERDISDTIKQASKRIKSLETSLQASKDLLTNLKSAKKNLKKASEFN